MYRIGIDAGSKTIKLVVIDENGAVKHSLYRRHGSNIRKMLLQVLQEYLDHFGSVAGPVAVTGSAGIAVAEALGLPFVQEVVATTDAVRDAYPEASAVIELGGEDAKVIYLDDPIEQRMNATCAGGTGGFIDTFASMMGIHTSEVNLYALRAKHIYPISHRCAVFAQSDVRPLLAAGVSKEDMAASVLEAVVKQTIGGLACGRPIRGNVVFLGGPLEFIPELYRRFCLALELDRETGIKPRRANLFTARGAAIGAGRFAEAERAEGKMRASNELSITQLRKLVQEMDDIPDDLSRISALFSSEEQREQFIQAHAPERIPRSEGAGELCYLGIDIGSTTVKYALVDEEGGLISSDCREAAGDALLVVSRMLEDLYEVIDASKVRLARTVITGSGSEVPEAGLKPDASVSDMTATLRAVKHLCPEASFVMDVGGQDMKAMWVEDGRLVDNMLNDPCSSGCGEFLADTARSMGLSLEAFDTLALEAQAPVELDTKCTVFMTSRVRHAQKVGATDGDIAAGIAYSVARNALHRVVGRVGATSMGTCPVVAGGTFRSDAVLRAFELVCGHEVIRYDAPHLFAALGAALIAKDTAQAEQATESSLIGAELLHNFDPVYSAYGCTGCENACMLSLVDFGDGRVFVSGNRCSKGAQIVKDAIRSIGEDEYLGQTSLLPRAHRIAKPKGNGDIGFGIQIPGFLKSFSGGMVGGGGSSVQKGSIYYEEAQKRTDAQVSSSTRNMRAENSTVPNVVAKQRDLLGAFGSVTGVGARGKVSIGIVNALSVYEKLPFWHTLFTKLGFSVLVPSDKGARQLKTMSAESIPSESACEPAKITHSRVYDLARQGARVVFMPRYDRAFACSVVCEYADAIADNVPFIADGFVKLLSPKFSEMDPQLFAANEADKEALAAAIAEVAGAFVPTAAEIDKAVEGALAAQQEFEAAAQQATLDALAWLATDSSHRAVVMAARPYHVDSELAHDVDNVLEKLGMAVLSTLGVDTVLEAHDDARQGRDEESAYVVWTHGQRLERYAHYVAGNPQLELVVLASFGCGYDAVNVGAARRELMAVGKAVNVLKIDDIVDPEHIAVRLATLAQAAQSVAANTVATSEVPAVAGEQNVAATHTVQLAGGITRADLETAQACVPQDLCSTAAAVIAQAVNALKGEPNAQELVVPRVCRSCLLDAMPELLARELDSVPAITWGELPKPVGRAAASLSDASSVIASSRLDAKHVRIGIIGNPLLCFDEFMNEQVGELVENLGAEPVFADPALVDTDDVRYLDQLARFSKQGVSAVLYLQSFGCLKGHAHARGALHEMRRRFPNMPVTVLDYDPQSSALNRENRVRLVVSAALRRASDGPKFGSLPARFRRASCIEVLDEWPFYHNTRSVNIDEIRNPYGAGVAGTPDYEVLKDGAKKDVKITTEMAAAIRAVMLRGR